MKKIVFAAVLAFSAAASAQVDFPNLWWPEEFTAKNEEKVAKDIALISSSKNVKAYLKQEDVGTVASVSKVGSRYVVGTSDSCQVTVRVQNGEAYPVKNSLVCE